MVEELNGDVTSIADLDSPLDLAVHADTPVKMPVSVTPSIKVMEGERELTTGMLSKTVSFRLIVNGEIGVKEIERLIAKLQLDKEILADNDIDEVY